MHVYNAKKNALRAAKKAGLDASAVQPVDGGFTVVGLADKPKITGTFGTAGDMTSVGSAASAPKPKAAKPAKASKPSKKPAKAKAAAKAKKPAKRAPKAKGDATVRPGSKNEGMLKVLTRPQGATMDELLKVTGWKVCSSAKVKLCRALGLTLTRKKDDKGVSRWFAA